MNYSDTQIMPLIEKGLRDKAFRAQLRKNPKEARKSVKSVPELTERQVEMLRKLTDDQWDQIASLRTSLGEACFCNFA